MELKPLVRKDGSIAVAISLTLELGVEEIGAAPLSFRDEKLVRSVEAQLATFVTREVRGFLWKIQREYNADILGFGQLFRRKKPEVWRRLGEDWDAQLRDLQVELDVQCKIVFTGTSSEPLLVRE